MSGSLNLTPNEIVPEQLFIGRTATINFNNLPVHFTGIITKKTAEFVFIKLGDLEVVVPLTAIAFMAFAMV